MKHEPLGKHAELIRGITFKPTDKIGVGDKDAVVCMRTKNVQVALDESDLIAIPSSLVGGEKKMLRRGDILVSSANSWNLVGKCCPVPELAYPATAGGFISILRPTNGKLDANYLYRWFSSEKVQATVRSLGNQTTNISNLSHKRTMELEIPLPSLAEQKRIAGILDAADALRAKRREALAQLDTLLQATFLDLFGDPVTNPKGWNCSTLDHIATKVTDGEHLNPEFSSDGMPIVMAGDVVEGGVDFTNVKFVPTSLGEKFRKKCGPERGDLLLVSRGATIGRMCMVTTTQPFCLMGSVILIKVNQELTTPAYLTGLLRCPAVRGDLYKTSGSSAQQAIYIKDIRRLQCMLPPLDAQQKYDVIVDSVARQMPQHIAHLAELDTLFASLQFRAFRGEL